MIFAHAAASLVVLLAPAQAAPTDPDGAAFFTNQVKPILAANCFDCHGGRPNLKGEFRLTSREGLLKGAARGPGINGESPADSPLLQMISYKDEHHEMPPSGKLAQGDIDILTQWVAMGAPWDPAGHDFGVEPAHAEAAPPKGEDHWAYQPVTRPEVPAVTDPVWRENPIDAFVRQKLDEAGLSPAPPASKQVLIRRLYHDLTGLPPAPEAVERFINDESPDAYGRLVDELLASPHYGERWARHWLDVVGYAETHGFERDSPKPHMWRYRDYVVNALNADKPYDQFVREQIAGDELPGAGPEQLVATGLYRLGIWDDEPADKLQGRYDELDGMVSTLGATFLGTTLACARCHDHKIDPFPMTDYYGMVAFLQGVKSSQRISELTPVMTAEEQAVYDAAVEAKNAEVTAANDALFQFEQGFLARLGEKEGVGFRRSDLVDLKYKFYRDTWQALPVFDTLRAEEEGELKHNFVTLAAASRKDAMGLVFTGKLRVTEEGEHTFRIRAKDGVRLKIGETVVYEATGVGETTHTGAIRLWPGHHDFRLDYFQTYDAPVLELAWSGPSFAERPLALDAPEGQTPDVAKLIQEKGGALLSDTERAQYDGLRTKLQQAKDKPVEGKFATTVTTTGPQDPETHILLRGNPHVKGDLVEPRLPAVLKPPAVAVAPAPEGAKSSGRRLVLADWLSSPENPLAARVMVNRIWQYHFDRGLVRTPNDFGLMGERPSHPELLDWLASEFVAQGWSMKAMHRLILLSNTYRMSAQGNETALAKDPRNDLFWRFNMRRLRAEEVRDSMLAVNGSINLAVGGPHVFPPMPEAVLATSSTPESVWGKSPQAEWTRRSLYTHVKRSLRDPLLADFDLADSQTNCAVRFATTQPAQALNLLNSEFVNTQAEVMARYVEAQGAANLETKVWLVLNRVLARTPDNQEVDGGLAFVEEMKSAHGVSDARAFELFCLLALNLNEFMYID